MDELQRLTERVQRLEDLEGIRRTWHEYMLSLDSRDLELYAKLFTPNAVAELRNLGTKLDDAVLNGRDEILDRRRTGVYPEAASASTGHYGTNLQVDVQGDHATTIAYFLNIAFDSHVFGGVYQHRMVRSAERWLIDHLRITVSYRAEIATNGTWSEPLAEVRARPF